MPDELIKTFSDEPIMNTTDDLLGRGPFSEKLADIVNNWSGEASVVVGLHAAWGEGKTSLINLLVPKLEAKGFQVLRFSPWEWASRADLNDALFNEIAIQLGQPSRKGTIEIAQALRRYATRLKGGVKAVSLGFPFIKVALLLCVCLSASGLFWPSSILSASAFFLILLAGLATWTAELFPAVADVIAPKDKDSEISLEQIRNRLKKKLTAWNGRVLVVLDDIDRLDPQQTADILRLIKANGDLPRIAYLLVGDRQIIADHVQKSLSVDGSSYLEKIIQLSFDLPSIDQLTLNGIFFEGLNFVLDAPGVAKDFDARRWGSVFWTGVAPSIRNLRSVKRLLATLQFHFDMLNGEAAFEVNPIDLVALETMRSFEPNLYKAVKRNKSMLLEPHSDKESASQLEEALLDLLLESVTAQHREEWKAALKNLFPALNKNSGRVQIGAETVRSWDRERRVCSVSHFDRYFSYGVRDGELSESNFQLFMGAGSQNAYREMLDLFSTQQLLPTVVGRLRTSVRDVSLEQIEPLVTALFDSCESLSSKSKKMFGVSELVTSEFLVDELLKRLEPGDVEGVLDRALVKTSGLKLPLEFLRRLWIHQNENRQEYPISSQAITRWQTVLVEKISREYVSGSLLGKDGVLLSLHLWAEWGQLAEVRKAVSDSLGTRDKVLEFLKGFVIVAHSSNLNKSGGTERPYIRHSDISKFIDPEDVYAMLELGDEWDIRMLRDMHPEFRYFEKAIARFRSGKSDDGFHTGDDDDV